MPGSLFRTLQRRPGALVAPALTLATGIGAVVAMFSVYAVLVLNPMSVDGADQLITIQAANPKVANVPTALSWLRFDNSLRHARSFSHIAAYDDDATSLTLGERPPEQLRALRVSSDFFAVLGVAPLHGRVFTAADDLPNGPAVCVLSHDLWQSRFGGSPIVGRTIDLNGRATEVVGVLRPAFTAPWTAHQLFLPRVFESATTNAENVRNGSSFLSVIGRLRDGVTIDQAQTELDGLAADYATRFAGRTDAANSTRARFFVEALVGNRRQVLLVLLAAVGAVLLVACANASTLFLGQLLARQRETAVRQALGASRTQIVAGFLLESLGLSMVAGLAGLGVAWALLRGVTAWLGQSLPVGAVFAIDQRAVFVAVVVVLAAATLVGLVPALYVTRPKASPLLSFARGESSTASGRRLRAALVLSEVALSCVLLIGAALLGTSLVRLQRASPGFDTRTTAAGLVSLAPERYGTQERQAAFAVDVVDRLRQAPGVRGAAAVFGLPLGDEFTFHQYVVAGRPIPPPSERERAGIRLVTEDYFAVMGIRLESGRLFTAQDRIGTAQVCIINESLARRMFKGNPIGESLLRGRETNFKYQIIGVVEDIKTYGLRQPAVDEVFYPLRQLPWPHFAIVATAAGDPAALRSTMERVVADVDRAQPLARFATMEQRLDATRGAEKAMASITMAFAVIALLMALVGLFAVLAQSIAARAPEISVRVALGATRGQIVGLIVGSGMTIAVPGIAVGLMAAGLSGRYLSAHLYGTEVRDPLVFAGVAVLFAAIALAACLVPSLRAAKLDPVAALRRG